MRVLDTRILTDVKRIYGVYDLASRHILIIIVYCPVHITQTCTTADIHVDFSYWYNASNHVKIIILEKVVISAALPLEAAPPASSSRL